MTADPGGLSYRVVARRRVRRRNRLTYVRTATRTLDLPLAIVGILPMSSQPRLV
jgi:hypothetical protein